MGPCRSRREVGAERRRLTWLVLGVVLSGCGSTLAHQTTGTGAASIAALPRIATEEDYLAARPEYDALALDAKGRSERRAALESYLLARSHEALDHSRLEEAYDFFKQALTLHDALELGRVSRDQALERAAAGVERAYRRRGAHEEVVVALAAEISLGDGAGASGARDRYRQVTEWLRSSGASSEAELGPAADGRQRLEDDLEAAAKVWPSPFVVEQLTALYLEPRAPSPLLRRPARGGDLRELLMNAQRPGPAYNLVRLYFRISRPEEAARLIRKLAGQPGDEPPLRALVEKLVSSAAAPGDVVSLAMAFTQHGRDDRDVAERVCRDAAERFKSAPQPRLCAGELALSMEPPQLGIALVNFEAAIKLDPSKREAWEALGRLYQLRLAQLASDENLNVSALEVQLKKVETFQSEAHKRFPDKPLQASMPAALVAVAQAYYNAGRLVEAARYLERSIALSPSTRALELYGQMRLKKSEGREAAMLFERAINLPKPDRGEQVFWRAKLRRLLADALEVAGDASGAEGMRKSAVSDWDVLIGLGLTPEGTAESNLEKAKLLYQLGDRDGSIQAFEKAVDALPDRQSTYADVIAFLVSRGELEEALDAYHRALGRTEVTDYIKVYCSLWIVDLARRAGAPEDPLATAYLHSTDGAKWYNDLARWASGREGDQAVEKRADTPGRRAELAFYRALRLYADGNRAGAKTLWKQVLDSDMLAFFEYDMAAFYLKQGGPPAQPLLRSKPGGGPKAVSSKPRPEGSI